MKSKSTRRQRMKSNECRLRLRRLCLSILSVDGAGKQMKDGAPAHVIPDRGVSALEDFLGERSSPFSIRSAGEIAELSQSEVPRVDSNDIEKTGLRFGVAEFL